MITLSGIFVLPEGVVASCRIKILKASRWLWAGSLFQLLFNELGISMVHEMCSFRDPLLAKVTFLKRKNQANEKSIGKTLLYLTHKPLYYLCRIGAGRKPCMCCTSTLLSTSKFVGNKPK